MLRLVFLLAFALAQEYNEHCAIWSGASCGWEPDLTTKQVHLQGDEPETAVVYIEPPVGTYTNSSRKLQEAQMQHKGLFGKFTNMASHPIHIHWTQGQPNDWVFIAAVAAYGSGGTATYPGHMFVVTKPGETKILTTWTMEADNSLYYYDPFSFDYSKAAATLNIDDLSHYHMQLVNRNYAIHYREWTGRDWLALHGQKTPPRFHLWRADAVGQTHVVTTKHNYFVEAPPDEYLKVGRYGPRPDQVERVRRYRAAAATMNLQLKAVSCLPRVFEIEHFLSDFEMQHLRQLGEAKGLVRSGVAAASENSHSTSNTRTSTNTWLSRHTDMITDAIYQRAADVLQLHESLLRWRHQNEIPELDDIKTTMAEPLQLVHYETGQKYDAHHDFVMPDLLHGQPARYATLLFYLNTPEAGGETSFPLWRNAHDAQPLEVTPVAGKAILFYNVLPDGNFDARSLHHAKPVREGEKYVANLWVWDPYMNHQVTDDY